MAINSFSADLSLLNKRLEKNENDIAENDGAIVTNDADVNENDGSITQNDADVASNDANVTATTDELADTAKLKTGVQGQINQLQKSLDSSDEVTRGDIEAEIGDLNIALEEATEKGHTLEEKKDNLDTEGKKTCRY